ncbi:MAG: hypothetical protein R6T96_07290, partial [Longimicrobiales bacterium]
MNEKRFDELMMELRDSYNRPPDTPREEMWAAIQSRLDEPGREAARRPGSPRIPAPMRWALAAAAVLVIGLGIGRLTAPDPASAPGATAARATSADPEILRAAGVVHLLQTESLLTLVRADARAGGVEPTVGSWAKQLLSQTRLLMDAQPESDPVMEELLRDLELVLVQIVGVANA